MSMSILMYGSVNQNDILRAMLQGNGIGVIGVEEVKQLEQTCAEENPDLVLFDFTGKGETQERLALIAGMRDKSNKPMVVLADHDAELLRILALNAGADDVIDSSCSAMEMVARVQAKIRCYGRLFGNQKKQGSINVGGLEVDDLSKRVLVKGNRVDLTPTEYKILRLLMETPGRVLSNKQIYESIWKMEPIGADNTVAVHVRHIREKIEEDPQKPKFLQVVWGQGYKVG